MPDVNTEVCGMLFEWDSNKAETNLKKHGVSFETAAHVFADVNRIEYVDYAHSFTEERYVTVGMVNGVLSVVYTGREKRKYRIISARKANVMERKAYQRGRF